MRRISGAAGQVPDASVICPEVTARQLMGFGYQCSSTRKTGEHIVTDSFDSSLSDIL